MSRKRFKGVENFLRRVAFNLGNTPSQTEVKIISCIPIDVTDLQQKIAELERKLEQTSPQHLHGESHIVSPQEGSGAPGSKRTSVVNTAAVPVSHKHIDCQDSSVSITIECHPSQKSAVYVYDQKHSNQDCTELRIDKADKHKPHQSHCHTHQQHQHLFQCPQRKFLFAKNKSRTKKRGCCNKTEFVYFAKPDDITPFNSYEFNKNLPSETIERHDEQISNERDYLSNVLWKQYMSRPALNDLSNASEFSSPICRDDPTQVTLYESDVCSCCHGPFQNLDQHMKTYNKLHTFTTTDKENDNLYTFNDSDAYDLVPVKENNSQPEKEHATPKPKKKHNIKQDININCWPEKVRTKKIQPFIVNYHTVTPIRNNQSMKPHKRYHKRDVVLRAMSAKRPLACSDRNSEDTKICYVDYSDVYARRKKLPKRQKQNRTPKLNDASCLTTVFNNTDCQTTTETNDNPVEDKTTTTLNQIKTILQSVLAEVKTNRKLEKNQELKKDAIVQNCSQSNICGGSQLLQCYTYSPYNMNPYIASCSKQMPSNSFCPTMPPYNQSKCIHYPLFVQPNRHMCSSCYKNGNVSKPIGLTTTGSRRAASASTNTEEPVRRSKETEKLIKDIYNSIALNIELPTRDTTKNQGDQGFNIRPNALKTSPIKEANDDPIMISEIYKNLNPINTSVTEKTDSKVTSKTNSVRSEFNNNRTLNKIKTESSEGNTTMSEQVQRKVQKVYEEEEESEDDDDDESTDVNEGDDIAESSTLTEYEHEPGANIPESEPDEPNKERTGKGLFSKMIKMFKSRNRKKTKEPVKVPDESESDSDDYQTVYSQKITSKARPTPPKPHRAKLIKSTRGKSRLSPERIPRRQPYLDQEYRRYWDEKLIFQNRYEKRSSQESRVTAPLTRPYSRNYEARVALTDPNTRVFSPIPNIKPTTYPVKKSSFPTNRTMSNRLKKGAPKAGGLAWLKKHKLNIQCGEQWKRFILEG